MQKFMLGTKGKMTQIFDEKGAVHAATVVHAGPLTVTKILTPEKEKYSGVQVGFGSMKDSRVNKAQTGKPFRFFREFPLEAGSSLPAEASAQAGKLEAGHRVDASVFAPGDVVSVSAVSKGKGFQGVVKRHGFHGGPRSHGQKNKERAPGSIGGGGRAGARVVKGMRMAGRMGGVRVTVKNLRVLQVDPASNTLVISGAIPGVPGALVEIRGQWV